MTQDSSTKAPRRTRRPKATGGAIVERLPILGRDEAMAPINGPLVLLPVTNMVLFPGMVAPISLSEESSQHLKASGTGDNKIIAVASVIPDAPSDKPLIDRVYRMGTAAVILKLMKGPDGTWRVLLHGLRRIELLEMEQTEPYPVVHVKAIDETRAEGTEIEALRHQTLKTLEEVARLANLPEEFQRAADDVHEAGRLADLICSNVSMKLDKLQEILGIVDGAKRLRKTYEALEHNRKILEIGSRIQNEVRTEIEQNQRDFFLREQLKQIRRELGDDEDLPEEVDELRELVESKDLPKHARDVAMKEISRLGRINSASPEYSVVRTYLDWILALPWSEASPTNEDLARARQVLDEDHYDLKEVKDRILEYLAVMKLTKSLRGPILCFVGPPGVGKTSLGRSIARATGREFYRCSLGGLRDEAEIRGHRRTYIGALPGRIIKGYKVTGKRNPVIMLDEIDKLGSDFRGDPSSALLEVLDPEQNGTFVDNYLDLPFDLSQTLFITTANMLETIPSPLRDRMEIIRLSGYTLREKCDIAEKYIVPRQAKENGLKPSKLKITRTAIERVIQSYTRESGLRELERQVGRICRKVAFKIAEGSAKKVTIKPDMLEDFLGSEKYQEEMAARQSLPGMVTGLAWTQVGGEILFIEVLSIAGGKGELRLTGQLGDVMKESAQAALSFLRAHAAEVGIDPNYLKEHDFHVHLPAGAIPKDGPSAGIAITTAIASQAMGRPVRPTLAMTGEVTLKGLVLPVGGIKEKTLAAARAGIKEVIMPARNKKDFEDIPEEVRAVVEFRFVDNVLDVIADALGTGAFAKSAEKKGGTKRKAAAAKGAGKGAGKGTDKTPPRPKQAPPPPHPVEAPPNNR